MKAFHSSSLMPWSVGGLVPRPRLGQANCFVDRHVDESILFAVARSALFHTPRVSSPAVRFAEITTS